MIQRKLAWCAVLVVLFIAGSSFRFISIGAESGDTIERLVRQPATERYQQAGEAIPGLREWPNGYAYKAKSKADKIDYLVSKAHQRDFHGNVLVAWRGKVIYQRALGNADFNTGKALTMETPFQLASVSKQFTAAAIMTLAQDSLINYDDDVRQYLPEIPYAGITIRRLLNHTAGLPNYMWVLETKLPKDTTPPDNQETVRLLSKHKPPLYFTPGKYFDYSNTGYMLLAAVVERVSGQSFEAYVNAKLFEPAGMENSFVWRATDSLDVIQGHNKRYRGYATVSPTVHDGCVGDKGVYATLNDLYLWQKAFFSGKIVSEEHLEQAMAHGQLRTSTKINYGFGFRLQYSKTGEKIVYHNGLWEGFRTSFWYYPKDGSVVVVLNHTNSRAKHDLVQGLNQILRQQETQEAPPTYAGHYDTESRRWVN